MSIISQGSAEAAAKATNAQYATVGDLAERANQILRARVCGVGEAASVCQEIRKLDPALAARFWKMVGGFRAADAEIVDVVNRVKALTPPAPEPGAAAEPPSSVGVPADFQPVADGLSEHLERTFGLGAEARELRRG